MSLMGSSGFGIGPRVLKLYEIELRIWTCIPTYQRSLPIYVWYKNVCVKINNAFYSIEDWVYILELETLILYYMVGRAKHTTI